MLFNSWLEHLIDNRETYKGITTFSCKDNAVIVTKGFAFESEWVKQSILFGNYLSAPRPESPEILEMRSCFNPGFLKVAGIHESG